MRARTSIWLTALLCAVALAAALAVALVARPAEAGGTPSTRRTARSARRSGLPRSVEGASTRPASATRSPSGTFAVRR
jgi:hypothetical protein